MRAIDTHPPRWRAAEAVAQGVLKSGVMFERIRHGVRLRLAGASATTVRCRQTIMDLRVAQDR